MHSVHLFYAYSTLSRIDSRSINRAMYLFSVQFDVGLMSLSLHFQKKYNFGQVVMSMNFNIYTIMN